ncbi:MAG: sulfite exporter TauE/SafE family protein [Candidatus Accumulibacter sp.]|jgi:uncharacterized membrane protein YfcA|nr:sulfite exporter TauE/SafE family protein [Accumulibacter sp.]
MITYGFILIGCVCFTGGMLNGATGFGALIVMVPMLLMVLDMQTAIPLGVVCCILLQLVGAITLRRHVQKRALTQLVLSSIPGSWLGATLLSRIPELYMKTFLGALFFIYASWCFTRKQTSPQKPPASFWAYIAGFCSGALGGAFGINGPPAVIYITRTGWTTEAMRGTLNTLLALVFLSVLAAQYTQGLLVEKVWELAMLCAPLCFLGNRLGWRLARGLRPEQYMRLVMLLILVMGLSLCMPALRQII